MDYIGLERMKEIESYIDIILKENFTSFSNKAELNRTFSSYINNLLTSLSSDEISKILRYTGIDYVKHQVSSYALKVRKFFQN